MADIGLGNLQHVLSADQIQKRVKDLAGQISRDYAGKTLYAVCVLENGYMFFADLVRQLDLPVVCQFIKPDIREFRRGDMFGTEVFFSPEVNVKGDVLLVEALLHSGVTTDFLIRNLSSRGAASVKVAALLDRPTARKTLLQPDYFGFLIDDAYVFGYGMGSPRMGRNLPYVATSKELAATGRSK